MKGAFFGVRPSELENDVGNYAKTKEGLRIDKVHLPKVVYGECMIPLFWKKGKIEIMLLKGY